MIRDLSEIATLAAIGGALMLGACDSNGTNTATDAPAASTTPTATDTDAGCPTGGCPTGGCPTDTDTDAGCPTGGCPTDTDTDAGCPTGGCPTDTDTDAGCPTGGCPTGGCPTDTDTDAGCPTGGCPTVVAESGFVLNYATSGEFFTRMTTGFEDNGAFHGPVRIYYTTNIQSSISSGMTFTAPVGTTAIKEQYDAGGDFDFFTVMTKQEAGFDATNGDWLYERRDASGAVLASGAIASCIGCHTGAAATTDYLLGTTVTN